MSVELSLDSFNALILVYNQERHIKKFTKLQEHAEDLKQALVHFRVILEVYKRERPSIKNSIEAHIDYLDKLIEVLDSVIVDANESKTEILFGTLNSRFKLAVYNFFYYYKTITDLMADPNV